MAVSLKNTFGENSVGFSSRAGAARALGVAAPARSRGERRATSAPLAPPRGRVPTQRAALPALSPNPRVFQGSVFCGREHNAVLFVVTKTRTWEPFTPAAPPLAPRFAAVPVVGRDGSVGGCVWGGSPQVFMDFVFLVLFVFFIHVSLRWGEGKYTPASRALPRGRLSAEREAGALGARVAGRRGGFCFP